MKTSPALPAIMALTLLLVSGPLSISLSNVSLQQEPMELEAFQGYLDPAPDGMDVRSVWELPGGRGEHVSIIDIEVNWNRQHNDLVTAAGSPFVFVRGVDPQPQVNVNHGTAILGILMAAPDGIGITGIAHSARLGLINPLREGNGLAVAVAIREATDNLNAGDVMLIEQQSFRGPRIDFSTGRGLVPIEYEADVFEAVKAATQKGIVVVQPSGNGFQNLDDPVYGGAFDRTKRDSGAIIVGSGMPPEGLYGPGPDRGRTPESNYGSRVDVQGWGRFVTTCGYGDLRHEQGENNWYTVNFGATSAAAAMVAGAAALVQSVLIERGRPPLAPPQLRKLLTDTGTPQSGDVRQRIGPRPNLRAALEALDRTDDELQPAITHVKFKKAKGKLVVDGLNFLTNDSVIEIDGNPVPQVKYPIAFVAPDGVTTRIVTKGNIDEMLPSGIDVALSVFTPSTGERSEPVVFRRP